MGRIDLLYQAGSDSRLLAELVLAGLVSCGAFGVLAIAKRFNNLFITFSLLLVVEILLVL